MITMVRTIILATCLHILPLGSEANNSAVILQYHNVSSCTPASTSTSAEKFSQHINWLQNHQFAILPLPEILQQLKEKQRLPGNRVTAITFDDAGVSVCDTAWPILRERQIPFTLFISTAAVEQQLPCSCSWEQLKEIANSRLATLANHSNSHPHMLDGMDNPEKWKQKAVDEIETAQELIQKRTGKSSKLFAYPYGEYNRTLQQLITEMGYTGFGQQSGAVSQYSDYSALPRFPASGIYADIETLSTKMMSLGFPAELSVSADSPITENSPENPPTLTLTLKKTLKNRVNCFTGAGDPIEVYQDKHKVIARSKEPLNRGRQRYNCTSYSGIKDRHYWISHQWLIQ